MKKLYLYNTLTRKKEEFKPLQDQKVGLYTCGPTVYNFAHIGNLRTYLFEDFLKRVLLYDGFEVDHVMNITDVGHLTSDEDEGEDKIELGARREGKTAREIADFYEAAFRRDLERLNILAPNIYCKATDNIAEQIELIQKLEAKGYTYLTSDGVYFDTSKFKDYNQLSHLDLETLREGARVEKNPEKKNPTDFALWKFSTPTYSPPYQGGEKRGGKRQMEWDSPWGVGFPGWHIECSAMSMKYLGEQFDLHCGGIDHINVHHTNEIAQSEAATGKHPWVKIWMHGAFLNIAGGKKMAKSEENFLTLENAFLKKGIDPLVFRFAALSVHYRKPMEYGEEAVESAKNGLEHLHNQVKGLAGSEGSIDPGFKDKFRKAINDDLNMPEALAIAQELLKSKLPDGDKSATILDFDRVFGLELKMAAVPLKIEELPARIQELISARQRAREERNWQESDRLRDELKRLDYSIEDIKEEGKEVQRVIKIR